VAKCRAKLVRKVHRRTVRRRLELHFEKNCEGILRWFAELDRLNVEHL
jgi:hypothetical protein